MALESIDRQWRGGSLVWVTRSFLDYRVPVYAELDRLTEGGLTVIYNGDYVPERVQRSLRERLGDRAVGLRGERRWGPNSFANHGANRAVRIPWQPGLVRQIRKRAPSMLITDGFFQWSVAALWLRARSGMPLVMCYERTAHTERGAQWYRTLYRRWALRYIDACSCSGTLCGAYTHALGVAKERITYGHMVADVETLRAASAHSPATVRAAFRREHGLSGTVFLYVGRLVRMKGIDLLVAAWQDFMAGTGAKDATLALVGDGPERAHAEAACRDRRLTSVRFLGHQDYSRLSTCYSAADCLVMPTLEDNWSLVVPEAMACGLPILCSTYNGCWPELVHEGVNGWVFDPSRPADFARVLNAACDGAQDLSAMGRRSQELLKAHTPRRAARAILDACMIACDAPKGTA